METQNGTRIIDARKLLFGLLAAMAVLAAGTALAAMLIGNDMLGQVWFNYGTVLVVLLSSSIGSVITISGTNRRKLIISGLFSISYWGSLLAITALFFAGIYSGVVVTLLLVLAGSAMPVLLCATGEKKHRKATRYVSHR